YAVDDEERRLFPTCHWCDSKTRSSAVEHDLHPGDLARNDSPHGARHLDGIERVHHARREIARECELYGCHWRDIFLLLRAELRCMESHGKHHEASGDGCRACAAARSVGHGSAPPERVDND